MKSSQGGAVEGFRQCDHCGYSNPSSRFAFPGAACLLCNVELSTPSQRKARCVERAQLQTRADSALTREQRIIKHGGYDPLEDLPPGL